MEHKEFDRLVTQAFEQLQNNRLFFPGEGVELPVLQRPLWGVASAEDPIFEEFKRPQVIGANFKAPKEWMPQALSVIAFFFPFTEEIRSRHREAGFDFDEAWRVGYDNHRPIVDAFAAALTEKLRQQGISAMDPATDPSFARTVVTVSEGGIEDHHYDVSWSNRHSLYAAGLGTFGLHRHIITEKGCCGGLLTLITDAPLEATPRSYSGVYQHCIRCGACIEKCPAAAISAEHLRNLKTCAAYAAQMRPVHQSPCGKCLVGIPCEDRIPEKTL